MSRLLIHVIAAVLSSLGALTTLGAEVVDTSVCDVLAKPAAFDGQVIRLKNATVRAGLDEFVIEDPQCKAAGAIWLSYPQGTSGKAGPVASLRLQLARNSSAQAVSPKRVPVALQNDENFKKFDSLLATPYKSASACLGCARYAVTATLVGRLDGSSDVGVLRDSRGKAIGVAGFGNLSLYHARLVLASVSDVSSHEIDYSASNPSQPGDLVRARSRATADQLKRAANAFGAPGEDNGVDVSFGIANQVLANDGAKGDQASPDGILFFTTFNMDRLGKGGLPMAMAHVGTHIADVRAGSPMGLEEAESRAWSATYR